MFVYRNFFLVLFVFFISIPIAKAEPPGFLEFTGNTFKCKGWWNIECMNKERANVVKKMEAAQLKFNSLQKQKMGQAITTPMEKLKEGAQRFSNTLNAYANRLFWILVTITFIYQFSFMVLKRSDFGEFFAEFVKFSIMIGFFYWLLINGSAIGIAIFNSFSTSLAKTTSGMDASPLGIILASADIFSLMTDDKFVDLAIPNTLVVYFIKLLIGVICVILLAIVAINYAILQATGYLVLLLGVIVLGFGGSPYTRDWALTYFRSAISLGIKLLTMTLVVATGIKVLQEMANGDAAAVSAVSAVDSIILLIAVVLLFKVADTVPNIVSSFIGNAGASASGINPTGAAAVSAMAAPVAVVGTGVKMGSAMAKGNLTMGNIGSALMAAMTSGSNAAQAFSKSIGNSISSNQSKKENAQKENEEKAFRSELLNAIKGGNGEGDKK